MTGRELIIYILENGLEDEPIFKDGNIIGYLTLEEAAEKMDVGVATILTWVALGKLDYLMIGTKLFISANSTHPYRDEYQNNIF